MCRLQGLLLRASSILTSRRITVYSLMVLLAACAFNTYYLSKTHWVGMTVAGYGARAVGGHIVLEGASSRLYDLEQQASTQEKIVVGAPVTRPPAGKHSSSGTASQAGVLAAEGHDPTYYGGLHFFVSPPFVAYLFAPLAAAPYSVGILIWTGFSMLLLILSLRLIWPIVPYLHRYGFASVVFISISTAPAFLLLAVGQDAAIALFLFALGLRLLLARRDLLAGCILGLGVYKPQLFLLAPVLLLLQRRWRGLGAWIGVAALLTGISVLLVGLDGMRSYLSLLTSDLYRVRVDLQQSQNMISLIALLRSLGLDAVATVVGVGAAFVLVAAFWPVVAKPTDSTGFTLLYAAMILISVLITPHVLVYDAVILFIPALVLLNATGNTPAVRLACFLAWVLTWLFPLHYGTIGTAPWTVVALIALLLVTRRLLVVRNSLEFEGELPAPVGVGMLKSRPS